LSDLPGTAAVVNAVKKDRYGIGYGGAAYAAGVKHCLVKKDESTPGSEPTPENIARNQYPITRYLYLYMRNRPSARRRNIIDWILSPEARRSLPRLAISRQIKISLIKAFGGKKQKNKGPSSSYSHRICFFHREEAIPV